MGTGAAIGTLKKPSLVSGCAASGMDCRDGATTLDPLIEGGAVALNVQDVDVSRVFASLGTSSTGAARIGRWKTKSESLTDLT